MDLLYLGKVGPFFTALAAVAAFFVAVISILVQRGIAQKRAAIDFFLKTEMDHEMLEAHKKYKCAVEALRAEPDVSVFVAGPHCQAMRSYLNVHELMAVGVRRKVFHNGVCQSYWIAELERARRDCNRLLLYLQKDPNEKITYAELVTLNSKWQRGW